MDEPDGVQLLEMLLSALSGAAGVQRVFVANDLGFQAAAFHPTGSDAVLAFAGDDGSVHVVGMDDALEKALPACLSALATSVAFDPRRLCENSVFHKAEFSRH